MALQLTDKNFQEKVLDLKGVALVDFWAEWCGPCRVIGPIIEELAHEYHGKVVVGKVDVDSNADLSMKYHVRSIPTLLILKNGVVVDKHVGLLTKQALKVKLDHQLAATTVA